MFKDLSSRTDLTLTKVIIFPLLYDYFESPVGLLVILNPLNSTSHIFTETQVIKYGSIMAKLLASQVQVAMAMESMWG